MQRSVPIKTLDVTGTVFLHLKRLVGVKREVGASLFLPPVVCEEGVADYVWFTEAGVEMKGYFVVLITEEIDLEPKRVRKTH